MKDRETAHILVDLTPESAYWRGALVGVAAFCREREGVEMLMVHPEAALIGEPERTDGIITVIHDAAQCAAVSRSSVPVVNISSLREEVPCPTVCTDNFAIGRLAAEHLLLQGYSQFAYHLESRVTFSRRRLEGFSARLSEAGRLCNVFDTGSPALAGASPAEVRAATAAWLKALPKPVGIFTHNDVRASALLEICRESNIDVPNVAGVIGNDNDAIICPSTKPTLTSIDNASDLIGYRAAEVLLGLIRGKSPREKSEYIAPRRVIERQSSQPALAADELVREAIRFIRENATAPITVDDVVRHVPISRRSLERRFQAAFARSPADEIRRVQFDRARHLLTESSLKLSEVAIASGYSRFSSFATAFQSAHALTPGAYRDEYRRR